MFCFTETLYRCPERQESNTTGCSACSRLALSKTFFAENIPSIHNSLPTCIEQIWLRNGAMGIQHRLYVWDSAIYYVEIQCTDIFFLTDSQANIFSSRFFIKFTNGKLHR